MPDLAGELVQGDLAGNLSSRVLEDSSREYLTRALLYRMVEGVAEGRKWLVAGLTGHYAPQAPSARVSPWARGCTLAKLPMIHGPDGGEAACAESWVPSSWILSSVPIEHTEARTRIFSAAVSLWCPLLRKRNILSATKEKYLKGLDLFL